MRNILALLLLLLVAVWLWGLKRAGRLFRLQIRDGGVSRATGRIPARLLADVADIIERGNIVSGEVTCVLRDGVPVLLFRGEMSAGVQQQVRNVVGQFSKEQIRGGGQGNSTTRR